VNNPLEARLDSLAAASGLSELEDERSLYANATPSRWLELLSADYLNALQILTEWLLGDNFSQYSVRLQWDIGFLPRELSIESD